MVGRIVGGAQLVSGLLGLLGTPRRRAAAEALRRFNEVMRRAAESVREFTQNATDAGLVDVEPDDNWEGSARRRTDDNLRGVFG